MVIDINKFTFFIIQRNLRKGEQKTQLHEWFAWYPVKIEYQRWVWLEMVFRKYKSNDSDIDIFTKRYCDPKYWEYNYMNKQRDDND